MPASVCAGVPLHTGADSKGGCPPTHLLGAGGLRECPAVQSIAKLRFLTLTARPVVHITVSVNSLPCVPRLSGSQLDWPLRLRGKRLYPHNQWWGQ
jgi:hypothetical protein